MSDWLLYSGWIAVGLVNALWFWLYLRMNNGWFDAYWKMNREWSSAYKKCNDEWFDECIRQQNGMAGKSP